MKTLYFYRPIIATNGQTMKRVSLVHQNEDDRKFYEDYYSNPEAAKKDGYLPGYEISEDVGNILKK